MKKLTAIVFVLLSLGLFSCNNNDNNGDPVKAVPTPKPMVIVDKDAALFVSQASTAALYEITLDRLAIKKGEDKRVKNFGNIMAKEHTKALTKLTDIANSKKIPVPTSLTPEEQAAIDTLLENNGKAFDRAYMADMAKNHENAIKLFHQASKQLMDPELRSFASKNVYNLQRHLDVVNMIRQSMK